MQESRKKEIRRQAYALREKCKVSRYGIIDLFLDCERLGYTSNFIIMDSDDSLTVVKKILKDMNCDPKVYNPRAIRNKISGCKNEIMTPSDYERLAAGDFEKIVCSKEDLKQVLEEEVKITNTVYMEYYKRNTAIEELNEVNTIASVQKLLRAIKESVAQNTENSNALFSEEEKTNIELAIYYLTRKITQLAEKEGIDFSEERIMLDELLIKFTKETTLVKKEVQTQLINISTKLLERIYSREGRKVEVKLPFHEPELRAYLGDAYCYTILGNEIVHSPWIYDKYVDIEYNSINEQIKYAYYDYYDMLPNEGPLIKKYHIEPMPVKDYFGITQIVKKTIDRGEYFVCFWNEYAAINYMLHIDNDEIFYHGCMVYGYNDAKKVFYMAGYFRNKYIHYELPYEVFIKGAILGEHLKHCYTYRSYRVNESFKPVYSNEKIIEKVETYLEKQYDENDIYYTGCEQIHMFIDGSPTDNKYEFCPYCGKKIKVAPYTEGE